MQTLKYHHNTAFFKNVIFFLFLFVSITTAPRSCHKPDSQYIDHLHYAEQQTVPAWKD